jgi:hypothetical protein
MDSTTVVAQRAAVRIRRRALFQRRPRRRLDLYRGDGPVLGRSQTMKPTALELNLLVAGFRAWRYWRRGPGAVLTVAGPKFLFT